MSTTEVVPNELYEAAKDAILKQVPASLLPLRVGIICGSGLSGLGDALEGKDKVIIPYGDIPGFVQSTAKGHKGQLAIGRLGGKPVICMQGRFHCYEGYSLQQATFPIRVMKLVGVQTLIVTNAAGALNPDYHVGDVVLLKDHINFAGMAGNNPLVGPNNEKFGTRFPSMTSVYDQSLRVLACKTLLQCPLLKDDHHFVLHEGVYAWVMGPSFETPADCRFLRTGGADLAGMSTVPETIIADHCGMDVLAMSLVTNECVSVDQPDSMDLAKQVLAGVEFHPPKLNPPNHAEVLAAGQARTADMELFVKLIVEQL